MKCRKCRKKAIAYMPEHRLALCREDYTSWFLEHTEKAIAKFRMMTREESVLVAVSGGKDSLALWHALTVLGYRAEGLYIDLGIAGADGYSDKSRAACQTLAERLDRKLHVVSVEQRVGAPIPAVNGVTSRQPCSACGLVKRYFMNRCTIEEDFDVVATGHNLDDEAAVLFANTLRWERGYLARQYPVLAERDGFKRKVKPFVYFSEKQTTLYALASAIDWVRDECPFAVGATSLYYKGVLARLEHHAPGTKRRFLDGFLKTRDLFVEADDTRLEPCRLCGQPTASEVCAYCQLRARVRERLVPGPSGPPPSA
jgi:uncharacterized protein (TIGR00269 family)